MAEAGSRPALNPAAALSVVRFTPSSPLSRHQRADWFCVSSPHGFCMSPDRTPVLIVYGLVGRWTMTDLQEDRSLVRNLLNLGLDLYVVDWGNPSRADRGLTLDDYIDGYL